MPLSVLDGPAQSDQGADTAGRWYVLWTHSHCEGLVHDQLTAKGFDLFLPRTERWSRRNGLRHRIRVPLFPGYLFVNTMMDKQRYLDIRQARGLVGMLGERWDGLLTVPDTEIASIRTALESTAAILPYPYLRQGQRVRITTGPLTDLEGVLVRKKENKGLLVLSIDLLQRAAAVEVDCTWVVPL